MALRLRKDVQKASYYVWFLGAEEARGLRGPRVLLPAIPNLIERSREQEPLKVTLQVSQKGMKIVQGSSKHFITHSAITCSVQAEDIVACVLLLYNPTTKCPLHVHAYRCDSETTAQALHQFLQVLINRPENQKRFAELEARLGLQSMTVSTPNSNVVSRSVPSPDVFPTTTPPKISNEQPKMAVRRFESSLGSDTGTSTRESECSEELSPPLLPKSSLYDSLAAELRAKLNGNGPPLLLPPRDYDTVHRSKGNLAATELRRCRNSLIVGDKLKNVPQQQQPIALTSTRSRGSSGIGSDLAPSPERPTENSSSEEDDWIPDHHPRPIDHETTKIQPRKIQPPRQLAYPTPAPALNAFNEPFLDETNTSQQQPPSYLYPNDSYQYPIESKTPQAKRHLSRSTSRENPAINRNVSQDEADIKPIIIRPRTYDSRFKHILDENKFNDDIEEPVKPSINKQRVVERKQRTPEDLTKSSYDRYADEQKVGQSNQKQHQAQQHYRYAEDEEPRKNISRNDKFNRSIGDRSGIERSAVIDRTGIERSGHDRHSVERSSVDRERDLFRENLTDREKYRESQKYNHNRNKDQFDGPNHNFGVRHSYAEPDARHHSPIRKSKYMLDNGNHNHNMDNNTAHHPYVEPQIERSGFRHRGGYDSNNDHHDAKLSRSFKEKPLKPEYDQSMVRNPYKEPESLPYRESIETMIKSPVMRYKSFETSPILETKLSPNVHSAQPNYPAPEKSRDSSSIRYHSLEADKYIVDHKPKYMADSNRRQIIEKQRSSNNGSPDTVCRVSPKDRFHNAREKFEAMERERTFVPPDARQHQMRPIERHHSPQRRDRSQQSRYPPKADWSSEDEQQQQQQNAPPPPSSRRTANGYRDIPTVPTIDPYIVDHSRSMAPSKSLGNLVRGYRHSYAEPARPQLPRNSGRVGLAAVNPF